MGHSDYLRPTEDEKYRQEVAQLFVFALEKLGRDVPDQLRKLANDIYCVTDTTEELVSTVRGLSSNERKHLFNSSTEKLNTAKLVLFLTQYENKKLQERARAEAEENRKSLRRQGLAKLTQEEKIVLGLAGLTE